MRSQYVNLDSKTLDKLVFLYPILASKKTPNTSTLELDFTALNGDKFFEDLYGSEKRRLKVVKKFQEKLYGLKYIHTSLGPTDYFTDVKDCQGRLTTFDFFVLKYSELITVTCATFNESNLLQCNLEDMKDSWNKALKQRKCQEREL